MKKFYFICFVLFGCSRVSAQNIQPDSVSDNKVYTIVQVKPQFPGNIYDWLSENIVFPENADSLLRNGLYISFIVEKNGRVDSIKRLGNKTNEKGFDTVLVKAASKMPLWTPGMQDGKPVRVQLIVPIHFNVKDDKALNMPSFPGDMNKWITDHTTYPPQIKDTNIHGTVYVSFKIEKDGSVTDISLVKGVPGGEALNEQALHIVSQMPKWAPVMENSIPVESHYITVAVRFKVYKAYLSRLDTSYTRNDDGSISMVILTKPQFKGDIDKWLVGHIKYPEQAENAGIQGTVYVSFVIDINGSVTDIKLFRGVCKLLDNEAIRVVSEMPEWIPGTHDGHPARVSYILPIHFRLD